jgi:hypothetical protein
MCVVEAGIVSGAPEVSPCPLCAHHVEDHPGVADDRREDLLPWAAILAVSVLVASLGAGAERMFGIGAAAGVLAGASCAWFTVQAAFRRRRGAHGREIEAMSADADERVTSVIRQFEWAVNDVVKLKRDLERAEAGADLLVAQARQRERYVRKLEGQLFETRERLVTFAQPSSEGDRPEFDPLADALAGIIPFTWSLHSDRYQVNLELECGVSSHRPTRVRLVDGEGDIVMRSGTAMWSDEGRAAFTLANPPVDLVVDLDAGREPKYTFEALAEYEWRQVRLEDSGKRTKVVTDKQGRLYRVDDEPDAAQLLAPTLPLN